MRAGYLREYPNPPRRKTMRRMMRIQAQTGMFDPLVDCVLSAEHYPRRRRL
jgi:hypothetical protein